MVTFQGECINMPKKEKKQKEPVVLGSVEQSMGQDIIPAVMVEIEGRQIERSKFDPKRLHPSGHVKINGKTLIRCPYCLGSGKTYGTTCPKCKGEGLCEPY